MVRKIFLGVILIYCIVLVSAVDISNPSITGVNIVPPQLIFKNETGNASTFAEIWITNEGELDNVADINAGDITDDATYRTLTNGTFTFDVDVQDTLTILSPDGTKLTNLTTGNGGGFTVQNDQILGNFAWKTRDASGNLFNMLGFAPGTTNLIFNAGSDDAVGTVEFKFDSDGTPNPNLMISSSSGLNLVTMFSDDTQMLDFSFNQIGITGKIGAFESPAGANLQTYTQYLRATEISQTIDTVLFLNMTNVPSNRIQFEQDGFFNADDRTLCLGGSDDFCLSYNGTNAILNPKATGNGLLNITGNLLVSGQGNFVYPYDLNIGGGDNIYSYIGIFNDGGNTKGAFFGMEDASGAGGDGDTFALYNYQGGNITFWTGATASTSQYLMKLDNQGYFVVSATTSGFNPPSRVPNGWASSDGSTAIVSRAGGNNDDSGFFITERVNDNGMNFWHDSSPNPSINYIDSQEDNANANLYFRMRANTNPVYAINISGNGNVSFGQNVTILQNLNATGNITSANVFIPQYIFAMINKTIKVLGVNTWTNVTFNQSAPDVIFGISHVYNDNTNHTFTFNEDGVYDIRYDLDMIDTSAGASDVEIAGRVIYTNGTEIRGSVFSTDLIKQEIETEVSHGFLAKFNSGDIIVFQFTASDVDVEISTHGTLGDFPESATIRINKVANL